MLQHRIRAFQAAFRGVAWLIRIEVHPRIHLAITLMVVALGWWLHIPLAHWAYLFLAMGLVWSAEALNTALEKALDVLHPATHPTIGLAKDIAAGGVLLAALFAVLVGLVVLGPPLWAWMQAVLQ